jgi:hypothetical protein
MILSSFITLLLLVRVFKTCCCNTPARPKVTNRQEQYSQVKDESSSIIQVDSNDSTIIKKKTIKHKKINEEDELIEDIEVGKKRKTRVVKT